MPMRTDPFRELARLIFDGNGTSARSPGNDSPANPSTRNTSPRPTTRS